MIFGEIFVILILDSRVVGLINGSEGTLVSVKTRLLLEIASHLIRLHGFA